ncbi:MAG: hypothetical protein RhofKO_21270 [Rhodothermales bacterium]
MRTFLSFGFVLLLLAGCDRTDTMPAETALPTLTSLREVLPTTVTGSPSFLRCSESGSVRFETRANGQHIILEDCNGVEGTVVASRRALGNSGLDGYEAATTVRLDGELTGTCRVSFDEIRYTMAQAVAEDDEAPPTFGIRIFGTLDGACGMQPLACPFDGEVMDAASEDGIVRQVCGFED